jgi:putative chitinase
MVNLEQLMKATGATAANAARWIDALNATMERFEINTPARIACFLAQCGHESAGLSATRENFNYSPQALVITFNSRRRQRFTLALAEKYGRVPGHHQANQQMIGSIAYADRMGNGDVESGDGFKYCGRGLGQLTGKDNYRDAGKFLGVDFLEHPELVEMSPYGALTFGWHWHEGNSTGRTLNVLADEGDVDGISRAINGGNNGLVARQDLTAAAMKVFNSMAVA